MASMIRKLFHVEHSKAQLKTKLFHVEQFYLLESMLFDRCLNMF